VSHSLVAVILGSINASKAEGSTSHVGISRLLGLYVFGTGSMTSVWPRLMPVRRRNAAKLGTCMLYRPLRWPSWCNSSSNCVELVGVFERCWCCGLLSHVAANLVVDVVLLLLLLQILSSSMVICASMGTYASRNGPCPWHAHSEERGAPAVDGPANPYAMVLCASMVICASMVFIFICLYGIPES
jgi:hypothetical protein